MGTGGQALQLIKGAAGERDHVGARKDGAYWMSEIGNMEEVVCDGRSRARGVKACGDRAA